MSSMSSKKSIRNLSSSDPESNFFSSPSHIHKHSEHSSAFQAKTPNQSTCLPPPLRPRSPRPPPTSTPTALSCKLTTGGSPGGGGRDEPHLLPSTRASSRFLMTSCANHTTPFSAQSLGEILLTRQDLFRPLSPRDQEMSRHA
jgi:hypothetical protein